MKGMVLLGGLALVLAACTPSTAVPQPTVAPTVAVPTVTVPAATPTMAPTVAATTAPTATGAASTAAAPEAVQKAQAWLASELGVGADEVTLLDLEEVEWPDACLGVAGPGENCAQVITPGWRAVFDVNGQRYEVHTDESGDIVRRATQTDQDSLAGTRWQLVSLGAPGAEVPVVPGSTVTLEFPAKGEAAGRGGCNSFSSQYQTEANTITFGPVVSTKVACAEAGVMEQEQRFFEALEAASAFAMAGDQLTITYAGGVLTLAPSTMPSEPPSAALDDTGAPITLLASYINALNRQEFERAYQYWETPPESTLEEFAAGFADTTSTRLIVNPPPRLEGAAGSVYASVPTVLLATHSDGSEHVFSGCYVARRSNVTDGGSPQDNPWRIFQASLAEAPAGNADLLGLLEQGCASGAPDLAYEDQSTPEDLLGAYYDAINRQDYQRAYDYWETPPEPTLEQFAEGFADTQSVLVAARPPARLGAAAGSQYADLPVFLAATSTAGTAQYFSGCFTARRPNNGDPSEPWRLYDATVTTAASGEEVAMALAEACPAR